MVPFPIQARFEETTLSIATAFLYSNGGNKYLVTNWHNVTGREPKTHKNKHTQCALPDNIVCEFPIQHTPIAQTRRIEWKPFQVSLYDDGNYEHPRYLVHPVHEDLVDVVAIPIEEREIDSCFAANDPTVGGAPILVLAGDDVYVLGYPLELTGGANFPIWKRGSVASEPAEDLDNLPKFFVDTATREGMSGAPVFAIPSGPWRKDPKLCRPDEPQGIHFGRASRFLGVYSGRVGADTLGAQLGIVWKDCAILDIIQGKKTGASSFQLCDNKGGQ